MRNFNVSRDWTVNEVVANIPEAKEALAERNISATNRFSLANAAEAASVSTDELQAVLEFRMRRAARQAREIEESEAVA